MLKRLTYMTPSERRTVLTLFALIIIACALIFIIGSYRTTHPTTQNAPTNTSAPTDSTQTTRPVKSGSAAQQYYATPSKTTHLTYFDPNTADSTQLLALGLQPWQVRSIYRYRAAGGVYTCPEDFARLYGLTVKKYRELRPYIRISPDYRPASTLYANHRNPSSANSYNNNIASSSPTSAKHTSPLSGEGPASWGRSGMGQGGEAVRQATKLRPGQTININTSDTTQLRTVPGIGPFFARKIDRYRTQLGGFVSKDQLLEITDFPESALPYFDIPSSPIQKLNINKASSEKLRSHPYITYMMARQIIDYRRMHGDIHDLSDLSLLPLFTPQAIERLRPYITY